MWCSQLSAPESLDWITACVRCRGMRHPRECGEKELEAFLARGRRPPDGALLGHRNVSTTMIYLHVLEQGTGVRSPLDQQLGE